MLSNKPLSKGVKTHLNYQNNIYKCFCYLNLIRNIDCMDSKIRCHFNVRDLNIYT